MKTITTKCVILGQKPFGEFHKLIYLYSEELGKIKAIAKGARKITSKFTGHLETLNFCHASFYFGPKNIILTEIVTQKNFKEIRENFTKLNSSLKIAEICNTLIYENQIIENFIELIEETMQNLVKYDKETLIIFTLTTKLLDKIGSIPDFRKSKGKIEEKFRKFFEYVKENRIQNIQKISLSKQEELEISRILKTITEHSLSI